MRCVYIFRCPNCGTPGQWAWPRVMIRVGGPPITGSIHAYKYAIILSALCIFVPTPPFLCVTIKLTLYGNACNVAGGF